VPPDALNERQQQLLDDLHTVQGHLREETRERYARLNPLYEDLTDWKQRGREWTRDDRDVTIYESTTLAGDVEIGEHTWIGPFCSLDGTGGLRIGSWCDVSAGCQILTHDTARRALSGGRAEPQRAPTAIGDCCFLGTHAVVLGGVTIGDHCLVGAGAVVTKDVPPNSIVAGVPARPVGSVEVDNAGEVRLHWDG
jgi:acetyltransferase-like isoleucine patch superfamily enzyme